MVYVSQLRNTCHQEEGVTIRLIAAAGQTINFSSYTPTICSIQENKEKLYGALEQAIASTQKEEAIYILGDLNARVGSNHVAWSTCIVLIGRINENGQILL